jgi:hypothetical protein
MNLKTRTKNGYLISTVQLPNGTYETMVFACNKERVFWNEVWCRRTRDERQAHADHKYAVNTYEDTAHGETENASSWLFQTRQPSSG